MQGIEYFHNEGLGQWLQRGREVLARHDPAQVCWINAPGMCRREAVCGVFGGIVSCAGAMEDRFTLMSAVKPFLLFRLLELHGAGEVARWVDDTPGDLPYYSLEQLQADGGKPRNAMINSGAMLLASRLPGDSPAGQEALFVRWLRGFAPGVRLALDGDCMADMLAGGGDSANVALARELERGGRLESAEAAYEIYFRLCCLAGTIQDVAGLGHALAVTGSPWRKPVWRTMARCGLYEASAGWFRATGLPAKSGVSGVMFGVWPDRGCVAACSPWLDRGGNPILPQGVLAEAAASCPVMGTDSYG